MDSDDPTMRTNRDSVSDVIIARTGFTPDRLHAYMQAASTAILAFVGACYAAGYAVVNIRLSSFGVYSPGFARAEYILAGAAFLIFLAVAQLSFMYSDQIFAFARNHMHLGERLLAVKGFAIGLLVAVAPNWLVLTRVAGPGLTWSDSLLTTILLLGVAAGFANIRTNWMVLHPGTSDTSKPHKMAFARLLYFATIVSGVFGIVAYAHWVYPLISTTYGGGKRTPVLLLVSEEGARAAQQLVLPVSTNNRLVGPVEPLTETDAEIVLVTEGSQGFHPKANAIRLRKAYVEAVINLSPRY
jgi:hypothetical protein